MRLGPRNLAVWMRVVPGLRFAGTAVRMRVWPGVAGFMVMLAGRMGMGGMPEIEDALLRA